MFPVRFVCLVLALACTLCAAVPALAAEVDCDTTYCFTSQDFSQSEDPLAGICITDLPTDSGTVLLGSRVLKPGDILTAQQISQMTFRPLDTETDAQAVMSYLPIYENRVEQSATMTISIRGKEDQAPVAQDGTMETYKNLPNDGILQVTDPEGKPMTYTLVRSPKRGDVELHADGTFTYTPKKNKVGVDSFTYTAADPAGNVSRQATVTVQILKPTDARQYTDTAGLACQFEAEWLRNTGLFIGESVAGEHCFHPEKSVSRGEFLTMLVQTLEIPAEDVSNTAAVQEAPAWLRPYLAAALRAGLLDQLPADESGAFDMEQAITGAEAAVMLQNALDLSVTQQVLEAEAALCSTGESDTPSWAGSCLTILRENGISMQASETLTRGDAAQVLYQTSLLALSAPGMSVIRMQQ